MEYVPSHNPARNVSGVRFATFEPIQRDGYKMTFDCRCGFKYQLSDSAAEVLANNEADIRLAPP